jgi:hypothetical protein
MKVKHHRSPYAGLNKAVGAFRVIIDGDWLVIHPKKNPGVSRLLLCNNRVVIRYLRALKLDFTQSSIYGTNNATFRV